MKDSRSSNVFVTWGALAALALLATATPAGAALTLSATAAADLEAKVLADNLGNPVDVAELPDGRVIIIEKGGALKVFAPGVDDPVVSNITLYTGGQNEQGLLGIVADPDFATNRFIYVYASVNEDEKNRHEVRRYELGDDSKLGAMKQVIKTGLMGPANHNGGGISIYGGALYVGVGDTGKNNGTPHNHIASCLNHANGKILRVSLAEASLGEPVADNPLMGETMVTACEDSSANDEDPFTMAAPDKRIFAWGFRNPFRIWADPVTGKIWVGEVGESKREEISLAEKGKHYGYPFEEGTVKYTKDQQSFQPDGTCNGMTPKSACVPPIIDYDHAGADKAVIGGRILDGCGWPDAWKKRYIFGDHEVDGAVWYVDLNDTRDGLAGSAERQEFATTNGVAAMRMGTDNALYIVERGAGSVTRITAKAAPPAMPGSCLTTNPMPSGDIPVGGSAGAATGGAGNAGTTSGGTPAAAGTPATAGSANGTGGSAGGKSGGGTSDDSSCGCRAAGYAGTTAFGLTALIGSLGLAALRRRRSTSRK